MIQARNLDFSTLNFGNYSTSEQDTGFTWIDGSTIYKKTINFGTLPNSTEKSVTHNISNLSYVVGFEAVTSNGADNLVLPIVSTSGAFVSLNITTTNITIITTSNRTAFTKTYVTIYYTKSS